MWSSGSPAPPCHRKLVILVSFILGQLFWVAKVQCQATTDSNEAKALNSIFQQWGISANQQQWNISGELCSGVAVNSSNDAGTYNPYIKCDCTFNSNTTCRITQLYVYALNVVGAIPEVLWNLTYLTNLNLAQNYLTGPLSSSMGNLTRMQWL